MRSRLSIGLPVGVLVAVHGFVLCAGFLAPYHFSEQDRVSPFEPPTAIRFRDSSGAWSIRPLVQRRVPGQKLSTVPVRFFVHGSEYTILGMRSRVHLFGVDAPARIYLLGTDGYGRDQLSRLLYGGRISLLAGLIGAGISLGLGVMLGAASGFFSGWVDEAVMAATEVFRALPWAYLLLSIRAVLPLHLPSERAFLLIVGLTGVLGWTMPARLVRGTVLSLRERTYVIAARGFGASSLYLLRRHILPDTANVVLTQASLLIPRFIMVEVALSFLGLGIAEPLPSWGNMLASLQELNVLVSCWWMWAPGFVLIPIFLCYLTLASALLEPPRSAKMKAS